MFFEKKIDTRSRAAMVEFLAGHYKYDSCYANHARFRQLGLTTKQMDAAYDLLSADENYWDELDSSIGDFTNENGGYHTISPAGRSSGYLTLRSSRYESTSHLSVCRSCGQRNFKRVAAPLVPGSVEEIVASEVARSRSSWIDTVYLGQPAIQAIDLPEEKKLEIIRKAKSDLKDATIGNKCGACGAEGERGRVNYEKPPVYLAVSHKGTATADSEDMADWSIDELRKEVQLVIAFDRACDSIREDFIAMLDTCQVVTETVMVPKTIRRIACMHG